MLSVGEALLTDLYQLTMAQAYFELGMKGTAVFELFVRRLPETRSFLLAAGLEQEPACVVEHQVEDHRAQARDDADRDA